MSARVRVNAFLADAVTRADGKLYAQGAGWNVLGVARVPAVHGHLGLALLFTVPACLVEQEHAFDIRLEDPSGAPVALGDATLGDEQPARAVGRVAGTLRLGDVPPHARAVPRTIPVAIGLSRLRFARAGRHRFVVAIDGEDECKLEFAVVALDRS
jgi:hypothetical protein